MFKDANYKTKWATLNTYYHGLPHSRQRLYLIAVRKDSLANPIEFPKSTGEPVPLSSFLEADGKSKSIDETTFKKTARVNIYFASTALDNMSEPIDYRGNTTVAVDVHAGKHKAFGIEYIPCLTRARGGTGGDYLLNKRRRTSIVDMTKLQGIPASRLQWEKAGISKTAMGRILGNAMSVNILERVFACVLHSAGLRTISKADNNKWGGVANLQSSTDTLARLGT